MPFFLVQLLYSISDALTFAGLHAINPRMSKLRVADIPTFLEPSTAPSTTAELAGALDATALGAYGADSRCEEGRRGRWCLHVVSIGNETTERQVTN